MPSINQVAEWQGSLAVGFEAASYGTLSAALKTYPYIGTVKFKAGPEMKDTGEGSTGTSERLLSQFAVGNIDASVEWQSRYSDTRLYVALASLFQNKIAGVGTTTKAHTWNPYTAQPATNVGVSIIPITLPTVDSVRFLGSIWQSVKISSQAGESVLVDHKVRGITATAAADDVPGTGWGGTSFPQHFNTGLAIDSTVNNVKPSSWELEIDNGQTAYYGTSQTPTDIALGLCTFKGKFALPARDTVALAQYTKYLNKTTAFITHRIGVTATNGSFESKFDLTYESAEYTVVNGLKMIEFTWNAAKNATVTYCTIWNAADLAA